MKNICVNLSQLLILMFIVTNFCLYSKTSFAWNDNEVTNENLCNASECNISFVSPSGSDSSGDGTATAPWKTINHALQQLNEGDTLIIKTGRYKEPTIRVRTSNINIIGQGNVVIDNTIDEFKEIHRGAWEKLDSQKGIFRSKTRYYSKLNRAQKAWGTFLFRGEWQKLITYSCYEALASDPYLFVDKLNTSAVEKCLIGQGEEAVCRDGGAYCGYAGPGVFWDKNGENGLPGYIYIRLAHTPQFSALGSSYTRMPEDPNALKIRLTVEGVWLDLDSGSGISVQNLTLQLGQVKVGRNIHNINLQNLNIDGIWGIWGIRIYGDNVIMDRMRITEYLPPWITWQDIKFAHYGTMQSAAIMIQPDTHHITIKNSLITRFHDAITALAPRDIHDLYIQNNDISDIQDDAVQLGTPAYNVDINNNRMVNVFTSVSKQGNGDNPFPGKKYIHHNIIDVSKVRFFYRRLHPRFYSCEYTGSGSHVECLGDVDPDGYNVGLAFGGHNHEDYGVDGDPRYYYNNTVVTSKWLGFGGQLGVNRPFGHPNLIFNNIFVLLDTQQYIHRVNQNWHSDYPPTLLLNGNIYYRSPSDAPGPFYVDGFSCDFDAFRNSLCGAPVYPPEDGSIPMWEIEDLGLAIDPELDESYKPTSPDLLYGPPAVNLNAIENLYFSTYPSGEVAWQLKLEEPLPGVDGIYRGAVKY